MKKTLLSLTALFVLAASAAFAGEGKQECKKCAGDKSAECCCKAKDGKSCDASKDAKSAPAPSAEKKN